MNWTLLPAGEFDQHAARWQSLNSGAAATPLLEPDFIRALLLAFGSGKELLACCESGGKLVAMTLLAARGAGNWTTFQPSQAPVSPWVQAGAADTGALLASLLRQLPGFPLVLSLTQRDPELSPRPQDAPTLRTQDYIRTARISIAGSADDYWAARGKNLRSNLKKQRAKLLKDGVATRMQISRDPGDMAAAVADYGKLESAGWKAQGGTAIHPDNAQGRFYRAMLEAYAARGAASVYRYWFDQQLVAMDFCIEGSGCIIVLKTTYDESVPNSLSPTLLMREEAVRQIFDEARFARLEFYGKVMDWHTRWTDEIRTMYHVTSYRWQLLLGLRQLKESTLVRQLRAPRQPAPAASTPPPSVTTE